MLKRRNAEIETPVQPAVVIYPNRAGFVLRFLSTHLYLMAHLIA
jgi:hypothetical protein